jgi:phosphopantetheine adenylyltransferase
MTDSEHKADVLGQKIRDTMAELGQLRREMASAREELIAVRRLVADIHQLKDAEIKKIVESVLHTITDREYEVRMNNLKTQLSKQVADCETARLVFIDLSNRLKEISGGGEISLLQLLEGNGGG